MEILGFLGQITVAKGSKNASDNLMKIGLKKVLRQNEL